jgi:hypothetical protein
MAKIPESRGPAGLPDSLRPKGELQVIISYAHRDERLRKELDNHLTALTESGAIKIWHDRKMGPGTDFAMEIDSRVETSDILLLLVSPDYLASHYCYHREMQYAIGRHVAGLSRVIPIILRPCDWHSTPMGKLLALPRDGKPVISWQRRDDAWLDVAKGVRRAVTELSPIGTAPSGVDSVYAESVANWDRWLANTNGLNTDLAKLVRSTWAQEYFGRNPEPAAGISYRGKRAAVNISEWDKRYRQAVKEGRKQAHAKSPGLFDQQ